MVYFVYNLVTDPALALAAKISLPLSAEGSPFDDLPLESPVTPFCDPHDPLYAIDSGLGSSPDRYRSPVTDYDEELPTPDTPKGYFGSPGATESPILGHDTVQPSVLVNSLTISVSGLSPKAKTSPIVIVPMVFPTARGRPASITSSDETEMVVSTHKRSRLLISSSSDGSNSDISDSDQSMDANSDSLGRPDTIGSDSDKYSSVFGSRNKLIYLDMVANPATYVIHGSNVNWSKGNVVLKHRNRNYQVVQQKRISELEKQNSHLQDLIADLEERNGDLEDRIAEFEELEEENNVAQGNSTSISHFTVVPRPDAIDFSEVWEYIGFEFDDRIIKDYLGYFAKAAFGDRFMNILVSFKNLSFSTPHVASLHLKTYSKSDSSSYFAFNVNKQIENMQATSECFKLYNCYAYVKSLIESKEFLWSMCQLNVVKVQFKGELDKRIVLKAKVVSEIKAAMKILNKRAGAHSTSDKLKHKKLINIGLIIYDAVKLFGLDFMFVRYVKTKNKSYFFNSTDDWTAIDWWAFHDFLQHVKRQGPFKAKCGDKSFRQVEQRFKTTFGRI